MSELKIKPVSSIGYGFVEEKFLPQGKDEYYLRNEQVKNGIKYRSLTAYEIEVLVRNNNTSDDWNKFLVSDAFNPELVKNCKFYGLVRIGKLEAISLEYHNVCMPVGLYSSTIISCDFGDNVIINNVNYLSHYIIGSEVMIVNVHEIHCTDHSKFGNGIIKEGESEEVRIWLEVCNENGGRKILPFNGMLPGDAYLWAKFRGDALLQEKFRLFTEKKFNKQRGYYGKIGDRCVIKNTSIIKDVWVGSDAYIKGANKLKNLTIKSSPEEPTQIGEGCELVNGIIDNGCRIFYGVKAVRFHMASNSQLKYGARLINSYLGNNSTISCCEVLNALIFPAHEQHHNNSFLCAALVMGQSNIAAGATIGSNHNSRAADGEVVAARGFWPALCVSLKHNSKFASFTLLARGDYNYELNIQLPFSLVSNDSHKDRLLIMPGYWFMYNMYALARNSHKYMDRDKRVDIVQPIEYDFLAPDSVNEIFEGLDILRKAVGLSAGASEDEALEKGTAMLENGEDLPAEIFVSGMECHKRPVQLLKVKEAYGIYKQMLVYYGVTQLLTLIEKKNLTSPEELPAHLPSKAQRHPWVNLGGQLLPRTSMEALLQSIREGKMDSWDEVHDWYVKDGSRYAEQKLQHAYASLLEITGIAHGALNTGLLAQLVEQAIATKEWMVANISQSRAKDYENPYRRMVYENDEEMEAVLGKLEDNSFILEQQEELTALKKAAGIFQKHMA